MIKYKESLPGLIERRVYEGDDRFKDLENNAPGSSACFDGVLLHRLGATQQDAEWQKLRRTEIAEAAQAGAVVIVPMGAIEQHGPHLPVNTDINTSTEIALRAAQAATAVRVLVAPPIWWGLSPYHMVYPGTLTLELETLTSLVVDVCKSLAAHGFKKILLLNGHGGNENFINTISIKLSQLEIFILPISYWNLIPEEIKQLAEDDGGRIIDHAGDIETSISLYLQPERVDRSYIRPGIGTPLTQSMRPPWRYTVPRLKKETSEGIYGLTAKANMAKGEKVVNAAATQLLSVLQEYAKSE